MRAFTCCLGLFVCFAAKLSSSDRAHPAPRRASSTYYLVLYSKLTCRTQSNYWLPVTKLVTWLRPRPAASRLLDRDSVNTPFPEFQCTDRSHHKLGHGKPGPAHFLERIRAARPFPHEIAGWILTWILCSERAALRLPRCAQRGRLCPNLFQPPLGPPPHLPRHRL